MGKEVKKVEFKDFLDTKGLSEDESKVLKCFPRGWMAIWRLFSTSLLKMRLILSL